MPTTTTSNDPSPLPLTGERTVPGVPDERYWFERHVVAYRLAAAKARGQRVLDAGCGEGYGGAMLRDAGAARVVAVDLDLPTVRHVGATYEDVGALVAELSRLPFRDGAFDLVSSFQVIEHVWDVPAYLASLRRVLRPGGELVLATPNRLTFTPDSDVPVNPFHVREFTPEELEAELTANGFQVGSVLGVHHGPLLSTAERILRRPLPDVLGAGEPTTWPTGVRRFVHLVDHDWFSVRADRLEASLDLVALCRRPRTDGR